MLGCPVTWGKSTVLTHVWKPLALLMRLWCIVQAGAAEKDVPLYKHLADLAGNAKLVTTLPSLHTQYMYQLMLNCCRSSTIVFHCYEHGFSITWQCGMLAGSSLCWPGCNRHVLHVLVSWLQPAFVVVSWTQCDVCMLSVA